MALMIHHYTTSYWCVLPKEKVFPCKHYTWLQLYNLSNKHPDVHSASQAEIPLEL